MRPIMLAVVMILTFLWLAGCVSTDSPASSQSVQPIPESSEYLAQRKQAFAVWQKGQLEGTVGSEKIWDCPLCPKLQARLAGGIWAGSPESDPNRQPNELPLKSVEIPRPYAIGIYEVTRAEFGAFVAATNRMQKNDCHTDLRDAKASFLNPGFEQSGDHPAVCVSWHDANDYVAWLNSQTSGGGYRLPTEDEWHAGGFGGGYETYYWGDQPEPACAYANVLDATAASKYPKEGALTCSDGAIHTAPVGRYRPGATAEYDVIGNAAEWTATCDSSSRSDCARAIVKGGSWRSTRLELRSAARAYLPVDYRDNSVGFRVARTIGDPDLPLNSAAAYLARGRQLMGLLEFTAAQADVERAVAMDPGNSHAISARGWLHIRTNKRDEARRDLVAALALDQDNAEAIAGLGACALLDRDAKEAVSQLDKALTLAPDYHMARSIRATAHMHAGNLEQSLADSALVLRATPTDVELLKLRVQVRAMRREWPEVLAETDQLALALPTLSSAQQFAASSYSALLLDDRATAAATRALSAWKDSDNYLLRADVRPWMDLQGRHADIAAALVLEPQSLRGLAALGELESRVGNHEVARQAFTNLLQFDTRGESRPRTLTSRGIESYHIGDLPMALKDFEAAPGPNPKGGVLNNLCWQLMAARVALDRAIGYCDRAIEQQPRNANFIASKATLMLRLGRWSDAIRLYDEALALAPNHANSWYGRGIAVQSRCKCMDGSADLDKALHIMPFVQRSLDRIGFVAPHPPEIPVVHPLP